MGVQVNLATKDGQGNSLPISCRQFISFSYGGKNIEDFDLIVIFSNGRLDKEIYSPFNDITSKNEALDGQLYWGSIFDAGRLSFNLVTDGMTSENYEAFKNYFIPGKIEKLILSEFPNRAIMARVASAPRISLLPFEDKREIKIGNLTKSFSTSLYKGDITLEFVMDDPYWFSEESCIDDTIQNYNYSDKDIKIIQEDGIPALSMFNKEKISESTGEIISINEDKYFLLGGKNVVKNNVFLEDEEKISLSPENKDVYLYNCGTAAAKPIINFTINPRFDEEKIIFSEGNSYFKIGKNRLDFITPNIITSYNQTVKILTSFQEGASVLELRQQFRDNLHNYYTRAYMIALLDSMRENSEYVENGKIKNGFISKFATDMKNFIYFKEGNEKIFPIIFMIDSLTGEATIEMQCYVFGSENPITIKENAGDMIKSKYLKIEDRTFHKDGFIDFNDCLSITTNCELSNLVIDFKYTYL